MPARVIHRQDALASGFSRQQIGRHLATGRWRRMLPSVYLISDTERWSDRIAAALLYAGPQAMLTGAAALQASEIRIARPRVVTVLVPPGCGPQSRDWVRLRRTARMPEPLNWMGPRRARSGGRWPTTR